MLISGRVSQATGTQTDNIFAGTYIEFMPADGILQFGMTTDQPLATADNAKVDILCGTELIASSYSPRTTGAASMPVYPDDFRLSCGAPAGVRIIGKHRNLGGATQVLFWEVMFDPA